jgi:hypothetical protein
MNVLMDVLTMWHEGGLLETTVFLETIHSHGVRELGRCKSAGFSSVDSCLRVATLADIDSKAFDDKRVLIFGGGETAADAIHRLVGVAKTVSWSIPNGTVFFSGYVGSVPADNFNCFAIQLYGGLVHASVTDFAWTSGLNRGE